MSELVDEPDLGSGAERRVGSSPSFPTILTLTYFYLFVDTTISLT